MSNIWQRRKVSFLQPKTPPPSNKYLINKKVKPIKQQMKKGNHTHMHACMPAHTRTRMHTHTHTHTYTQTDYSISWLPGQVKYGTLAAMGSICLMNSSPTLALSCKGTRAHCLSKYSPSIVIKSQYSPSLSFCPNTTPNCHNKYNPNCHTVKIQPLAAIQSTTPTVTQSKYNP